MSGLAIAAEVAAALREAGEAVGAGPLIVTLEKPGATTGPEWAPVAGTPTTHELVAIDQNIRHRDETGTLIGTSSRVLMVEAAGVVPAKADRVQVRGVWHEIVDVMPEATGGVDLFYSLTLST